MNFEIYYTFLLKSVGSLAVSMNFVETVRLSLGKEEVRYHGYILYYEAKKFVPSRCHKCTLL